MNWINKLWKKILNIFKSPYTLILDDKFTNINTEHWSMIPTGKSSWNINKIVDHDLISIGDFGIRMYGKSTNEGSLNAVLSPEECVTVGLYTKNKVSADKGKVEVVARFHNGQGSWPAIWLAGEKNTSDNYIEIDISEYLNNDTYTNTTIHSNNIWKTNKNGQSKKCNIDPNKWNKYVAEWNDKEVKISINGKTVNTYKNNGEFGNENNPMFLLIDTQLGGKWVGEIHNEDLPVWMDIKSVKMWKINKH